MKKQMACVVLLMTLVTQAFAQPKEANKEAPKEVRPVASVNLERYAGKWFEIARFPNWFQKQCKSNVIAEYALLSDGNLEVKNQCIKKDGTANEEVGIARIVDSESNAKLEVTFSPDWAFWLPMVWGDYWILAVGPDYAYAVVGVPSRKYLWILSRTPSMSKEAYDAAVKRAAEQGFEVKMLVKTKQNQ